MKRHPYERQSEPGLVLSVVMVIVMLPVIVRDLVRGDISL